MCVERPGVTMKNSCEYRELAHCELGMRVFFFFFFNQDMAPFPALIRP